MDKRLFFGVTQQAVDRLTFTMGEYSVALIALEYLRLQTKQIMKRRACVSNSELRNELAAGLSVHWQDFKGLACATQWEQHEVFFSWALLEASISTFEGWVSDVGRIMGLSNGEKTNLQVPEHFQRVVSRLQRECHSASMRRAFYDVYGHSCKCCYPAMASMLHCFRFFKEMRNAFVHEAGRASERLVRRIVEYQRICTRSSLHVNEVPVVNPCAIGDVVVPVYRGIIGFTDVLIRILVSYDSELLCTTYGEAEFLQRYEREKYPAWLPGLNKQKAGVVIGKGVKRAGFRQPNDMDVLRKFIIDKLP